MAVAGAGAGAVFFRNDGVVKLGGPADACTSSTGTRPDAKLLSSAAIARKSTDADAAGGLVVSVEAALPGRPTPFT